MRPSFVVRSWTSDDFLRLIGEIARAADMSMNFEPRLVIRDALGSRTVSIDKPAFTIGRRNEVDLRLPGADVSRVHAEIDTANATCVIHDKQSRFGTFVNGERVTERVLAHGDQVRLGQAGDTQITFLCFDDALREDRASAGSDVAGVAVVVERRLTDDEYYGAIAATLEHDTVHCPGMDSAELQRQLRDRHSPAFRLLHKGFHHVVEFDAQAGCDAHGDFDLTRFLGHISQRMSDAFGLRLPHDEFHPEEVSQMLKDEQRSLFCFLNVSVVPRDQLQGLRGFGQEHHRMLLCGPHPLDAVKAKSVDRIARHTEFRPGVRFSSLIEGLRALGSGRVLDEVLAMVLDSAIEVTGAERGFIMLASPGKLLEFRLARSRGKVTLSGPTFETSRKIPEAVFATGRQTIVEDLLDGDLADLHAGTIALGIRHVLCTPLRLVRYVEHAAQKGGDEIIGVLYLDSRERGALRSAQVQSALETLSAEAAHAIENARLYLEALDKAKLEEELKVAGAIQQSLLPVANRDGGFFSTAAASIACRAVGGDFFDYVDLPTGRFGFIVGDVAGKGSAAALLAAAVLGMFTAEATRHEGAAPLMERLNRGVFRRAIDAHFLTGFYGILGNDGALTYCNAGHNAPMLVSDSGIRRLETGGVVLGLFEHATFEEETVQLLPGDLVVVFSDGVTEAMNPDNEEFTDDRLLACASVQRGSAPQAVLDALLADVRSFSAGATQGDDMTVLVLRYEGDGPAGGASASRGSLSAR